MNQVVKFTVISMLIAALGFGSSPAFAKGGGHGGGKPSGLSHGEKKGWDGKETPPGWTKGEKKGWDGATVPPGLSEKGSKVENEESDKK